jgi:hypothetical protein
MAAADSSEGGSRDLSPGVNLKRVQRGLWLRPGFARLREMGFDVLQRLLARPERSVELQIFDGLQNLLEHRSGLISELNQIVSRQKRSCGRLMPVLLNLLKPELIELKVSPAAQTIHAIELQVVFKIRFAQKPPDCAQPHIVNLTKLHVCQNQVRNLIGFLVGHFQAAAYLLADLCSQAGMPLEALIFFD